jgi:predicted GIY-YIG superfamily endonuclease
MGLRRRYEVYVLLDEDRVIRYVGCTQNPEQRRTAHLYDVEKNGLLYQTYRVFGYDREEAAAAEKELIRTLYLLGHDLLNKINEEVRQERTAPEIYRKGEFYDGTFLERIEVIVRKGRFKENELTQAEKMILDGILRKFE